MGQKTEILYGGPRGYGKYAVLKQTYLIMLDEKATEKMRYDAAMCVKTYGPEVAMSVDRQNLIIEIRAMICKAKEYLGGGGDKQVEKVVLP